MMPNSLHLKTKRKESIFILPPVVSSRIDKSRQMSTLKSIQFGHPWHASDRNGKTFVSNGPHPSKSSACRCIRVIYNAQSIRLHLVPLFLTALPIKEKQKLTHLWHNHFLIRREQHLTSFLDYSENTTKFWIYLKPWGNFFCYVKQKAKGRKR